jgi:CBS domain-containing protein
MPESLVHAIPASLTAADAMTSTVVSAERSAPLRELVLRMATLGRRAVPVTDRGIPVGMVTQGDLIARGGVELRIDLLGSLGAAERDALLGGLAADRTAADVMTPDPVTVPVTASLRQAAELMARRRLKRLPVTGEDGRLAGILSRVDVLRAAAGASAPRHPAPDPAIPTGFDATAPVSAAARRDAPAVYPDTPLAEVVLAVVSSRLNRALVVGPDRRVLGIVTDQELLDKLAPPLRRGVFSALVHRLPFGHADRETAERVATARTARDLMVPVPTAHADTPLREAIALVLSGAHKLLAVVDSEGRLEGVLDRADLLRGLVADR